MGLSEAGIVMCGTCAGGKLAALPLPIWGEGGWGVTSATYGSGPPHPLLHVAEPNCPLPVRERARAANPRKRRPSTLLRDHAFGRGLEIEGGGEQGARVGSLRIGEHFDGGPLLHHLAVAQDE